MPLDDLLAQLADIAGVDSDAPKKDNETAEAGGAQTTEAPTHADSSPETHFMAFAREQDAELDETGAQRLVEIVFYGQPRLVLGYDGDRIEALRESWLTVIETDPATTIGAEAASVRGRLLGVQQDVAAKAMELALREASYSPEVIAAIDHLLKGQIDDYVQQVIQYPEQRDSFASATWRTDRIREAAIALMAEVRNEDGLTHEPFDREVRLDYAEKFGRDLPLELFNDFLATLAPLFAEAATLESHDYWKFISTDSLLLVDKHFEYVRTQFENCFWNHDHLDTIERYCVSFFGDSPDIISHILKHFREAASASDADLSASDLMKLFQ